MSDKLSKKQEQFCREYLVDLNATQAAIRAGYSKKTAKSQGNRLMTDVDIQARVQSLMDERVERTNVTADNVLREIARLGFSDMRELFDDEGNVRPLTELSDDAAAAIQGADIVTSRIGDDGDTTVTTSKIKLADKKAALELLGKHLKLFKDQHELSGSVDVNSTVEFVEPGDAD